jgi:AbrB family looped-hinge helix DNA binding protein
MTLRIALNGRRGKMISLNHFTVPPMSTVKLSSKNQVVIPQEARKKLGVGPGARLLVLVKEDRIVFMPEPRHFVKRFSGRHKGVWGKGYLERERRAWRR